MRTLRVLALLPLVATLILLSGCRLGNLKGAKITEGTDITVGIPITGSQGSLTLDLMNYLTGFRLGVAENAQLRMTYTCSETNEYLGIITTRMAKSIIAEVEPCADDAQKREDSADADGEKEIPPEAASP